MEALHNYLISHYSDFVIVGIGTFVLHEIYWFLFNLPYLLIEDYGLFEEYKIQKVLQFVW